MSEDGKICAYYAKIGYPELSSGELLKAARTLTDKPVFFDGKLGFENRKQSLEYIRKYSEYFKRREDPN